MSDPFLTIFTPTYNRAHTLGRLYRSLVGQTDIEFEWLVVDDGSEDGTTDMVCGWAKDSEFPIRYFRQDNSGKHVAHNTAATISTADYFICVDSDDWLEREAVSIIHMDVAETASDTEGLLYPRLFAEQTASDTAWLPSDATTVELGDMRMRYGLAVETAIVFPRKVLLRHPFPVIEGESFIPEESAYYRFRTPEVFRVHDDCFYRCEYRADGLTRSVWMNWFRNPVGTKIALSERFEAACRYDGVHAMRERASAIVGVESLNMALGLSPFDDVSGHIVERVALLPLAGLYRMMRYGHAG